MNKSDVIGDNINALRIDRGYSQESFADAVGVSQVTVSNWETASHAPSEKAIVKICEKFGVAYDDIVSSENGYAKKVLNAPTSVIKPTYSYHAVPMLGNVAAGEWREVYEQRDEAVCIPDVFAESHPRAFGVKPTGGSMDLVFDEKEIAICDPDLEVRDEDIAVVGVNGDEATIKRVYYAGNYIVLHAESSDEDAYPDIAIDLKDPSSPPVHMIGRVFWKTLPAKEIKL